MKRQLLPVCIFILFISCAENKTLLLKKNQLQPQNLIESHSVNLDKKFTDRIVPAPAVIVSAINRMDSTDKYTSYNLTMSEKKIFADYFELLPVKFKELMEKRVLAVYFLKNFTGGGMTDYVLDKNGEMYIALYFNPALFRASLSKWINFRDNSSFSDRNKKIKLKSYCETDYLALLHTIVHESSHVYDYYFHITPVADPSLDESAKSKSTEFTKGVWENFDTPVKQDNFKNRGEISSYGLGKKIDNVLSVIIYRDLNRSHFSSLYGSSSWTEDFAETFTWFYLNKKFGIRYRVIISEDKKEEVIFSPTENKPVTDRYRFIDRLAD